MKTKDIIKSILQAIAGILMFVLITTKDAQVSWLFPLTMFLIFISNLVENPNLGNESIKITRNGVIFLLLIILVTFLVVNFHDQYDQIRETVIFKILIAVIIISTWIYDIRQKYKMHNKSVKQTG